jgi:hypothetical protein
LEATPVALGADGWITANDKELEMDNDRSFGIHPMWRKWYLNILVLMSVGSGTITNNANAFAINFNYDSSVANAPSGFVPAMTYVGNFLSSTFTDPIDLTIHVGWGEINGYTIGSGYLGRSSSYIHGPEEYTYDLIKSSLAADATSIDDFTAVNSLPATDPTTYGVPSPGGGYYFGVPEALANALGLPNSLYTSDAGSVGFGSSYQYTFDPNNRAVANEYDFIGVAFHEVTEVMGRLGSTQLHPLYAIPGVIDLFHYTAPGAISGASVSADYLSIDGGNTAINWFNNGSGGGDRSDWSGLINDSFNAFLSPGVELAFSEGDFKLMDVIGYDRASTLTTPIPASVWLFASGLLGMLGFRSRDAKVECRVLRHLRPFRDFGKCLSLAADSGPSAGSVRHSTKVPDTLKDIHPHSPKIFSAPSAIGH